MVAYKRKVTDTKRAAAKSRTRTASRTMAPRRSLTSDQTIMVSTYFEVHSQCASSGETELSYAIRLDPKALEVYTENCSLTDGGAGEGNTLASGAAFALPKWTTMSGLFNQYNVRSASVNIQCSREGSEFPLILSSDIGDNTPCTSTLNAVSGSHKTEYITENRRQVKYGVKNVGQQLDFMNTTSTVMQAIDQRRYIKVYQHKPKVPQAVIDGGGGIISHGVTVYLTLGLKDSRHLN